MKIRPLAATVGVVALTALSAVTAQGTEPRLRGQTTVAAKRPSVPNPAGAASASLLAAAVAARKDSDPELNGAIQDLRPAAGVAARR